MRHDAGLLCDGIRRALQRARNAICRCAASQCFYHAASHCSRASNLSAVQSTLKVSYQIYHFELHAIVNRLCTHSASSHFIHLTFFQFIFLSNRNENIFSLTLSRASAWQCEVEIDFAIFFYSASKWVRENLPHKLRNFSLALPRGVDWCGIEIEFMTIFLFEKFL